MDLGTDVRLAFRRLRRSPAMTALAVLALAIGLGATSAIFTLVRAVLIEGVPFEEADRLVQLSGTMNGEAGPQNWPVGYLDLRDMREQEVVEGPAAASYPRSFNLVSDDVSEHVTGELVSWDYFGILRASPQLGRSFVEREDDPTSPARVAVISDDFWRRAFGGRADIVGRTIQLNEIRYEVIGVAPPRFRGLTDQASVWLPISMAGVIYQPGYTSVRAFRWLSGVARLKPGVTLAQAEAGFAALNRGLAEAYPTENARFEVGLTPISEAWFGDWRQPLLVVLAAATFVLLIACSNVASLLLVRGMDRRREVALRSAIGAARSRLVRQFLVETIVLVLLGTAAGLLTAEVVLRALIASGGLQLASFIELGVDPVIMTAATAVALLCALAFGTAPALFSTRVSAEAVIRESSHTVTASRARRGFQDLMLGVQIALAFALLTGAGVMTRGFARFAGADLGFEPGDLLTARIDLTAEPYRDNDRFWTTVREVSEAAAAVPGVTAVTAEGPGLPTGGSFALHFIRADRPEAGDLMTLRHHVTPGYFAALGIPVLSGRVFTDSDRGPGSMVPVVVSETFARLHFADGDAVGRTLAVQGNDTLRFPIIGVVADARLSGITDAEPLAPDVYLPLYQSPPRIPPIVTLLIRHRPGARDVAAAVDEAARRVAPDLPLFDVRSMDARLRDQTATGRLLIRLVAGFSVIALLLAGIGVYGVISYAVRLRTREFGIRMALGASRAAVLRHTFAGVVQPVGLGVAAGIIASLVLGRFAESLLYGLSPRDPATLAAIAFAIVVVAALAAFLPARRALRTDPRSALST